ncbi:sensor histidine kinase [Flavivirga jejuensis]|uniref:Histidine kinase n=1 Tax=Flavivirga jejuensis TaxID=870487 RepID=A0ABT8WV95_9FLAO|nr:histidine kinase [Flavivirga jejuensis]MDO5977009.1 histidine kinase [Flavivirga jejuensis]
MNKFIRLIIQVILWLAFGLIIWLNQGANSDILKENLVVFVSQLCLISGLIFFMASKLFFKKKYVLFTVVSVIAIIVTTYILTELFAMPIEPHQPINDFSSLPPESRRPPSHFLFYLLILTITYILALSIEVFIHLRKKEEETIKAKNVNLLNELKLLKSQISPHFLFNSLNNIYTLAGMDSNKTQKSIIHLSDMLRYVLYECEQETVPIKKEVKYIENYLKLFALKSSKDYPISIELKISNNSIPIAPMLLIPFIENALKHSNIDDKKNSFINIEINADDKNIDFKVENSIPQKSFIKDDVGGIGLENVKKRLAIIYPEKHMLEISESNKIFIVKLHLKLT